MTTKIELKLTAYKNKYGNWIFYPMKDDKLTNDVLKLWNKAKGKTNKSYSQGMMLDLHNKFDFNIKCYETQTVALTNSISTTLLASINFEVLESNIIDKSTDKLDKALDILLDSIA